MNGIPVTLALGGGGARGMAHLGVIEVLLDAGYSVERIVGVSIGSLVGALYAFDPDIHRAQQRALDYLLSETFQRHQKILFGASSSSDEPSTGGIFTWYDRAKSFLRGHRIFQRVIRKPSLLPGVILQDVVEHLLPDADIAEATIPLSVVSVDLRSGHKVILESGPLRDAVRASSALPGIFPPVELEGMLLTDIGVFYSLPTTVARTYASEYLIAVDVSTELKRLESCETALDVLMRMDEIGESLFRKHVRDAADLVISPDVSNVEWFDFSSSQKMVEAGRRAAKRTLPALDRQASVLGEW